MKKSYSLKLTILSAALVLCAAAQSSLAAIVQVGDITGYSVTTNSAGNIKAKFNISTGGDMNVTVYAPDVVRVDFHWAGDFATEEIMIDKTWDNWANANATLSDQGTYFLIETIDMDVVIEKTPFKIHFKDKSGFYLLQDDFHEYNDSYNYTGQSGDTTSKLKARKIVPTSQAFFGLGEYGGPMNRRGRELECWNTGTYNWGEFTNPTYLNIPFFYGLQPAESGNPAYVYGVFFHNPTRPKFKFGTEGNDKVSFQAGDGRMDYFFFAGGNDHTFKKVINRYSELIGRPTFIPKWGLGYQLSRFSYSNQSWVEYIADEAVNTDIPLDGVYLDIDYMDSDANDNPLDGNLHQLTFNSNFPDPAGMVSYCHTRGVKVVPLIEPWLPTGDPMYGEANGAFHFIKDNGGSTVIRGIYVGDVSWFDYTSSSMQGWWQGKIINWFNSVPMDGIWNDLTEPEGGDSIPYNALHWLEGAYGDQNDSRRHWSNERNYFGLRCSRQSYNTMLAKYPNNRPFILGRSGNAGLQRYAVSWSGDTAANYFYHEKTLRFGMGAIIAGAAWYGNDVGGFAGTPSDDLMVRSTEANFLAPFFRNHGDKSAANREPWRFGEPAQSQQRYLIKLRYRLMPYLYTLAYEASQTGEPMNVPPAFDYFADANTHNNSDYEFLVGDYIFSAPVYSQGASSRNVYLPWKADVEWYYWPNGAPDATPSGTKYGGGQTVNVSAPVGTCPLFVRSGAIIPMGPAMQHANEFQPDWMDIHCWPEGDSEFTLFEDDGESWDYLSGDYAKARMVSSRTEDSWNFTIQTREGTYDPGARDYYIYMNNPRTNEIFGVTLNGAPLAQLADFGDAAQGWRWMPDGRLGVKAPDTGAEIALIVSIQPGIDSIQFTESSQSVSETNGSIRIYASRIGAATGAVTVAYTTSDGNANGDFDYNAVTSTLNWAASDTADKYFDIVINDDPFFEIDETFSVTLSDPVGAQIGSPDTTTITIVDDEPPPGTLQFTSENYSVDETDGNVRIYVSRTGGSGGPASVMFGTENDTALDGIHYTQISSTLNWTDGDAADKFFDVSITDNNYYDADRVFNVSLSNATGAALSSPAIAVVTINEDEPVPPALVITNPPSDTVVSSGTSTFNLQGVANATLWSGLNWSNNLTGATGTGPADFSWMLAGIGLDIGTNMITVTATNLGVSGANDGGTNFPYADGWQDGDNGGTGWASGWELYDEETSGHFMAGGANANNDAGTSAFGIWANNGALADAKKNFAAPMAIGQEFSFRFDNNFIENGSSVGFGMQNAAGQNLFEFFFTGGDSNYTIYDSIDDRDTGIGWSDSGWDITFTLTNSTAYVLTCGGTTITGILKANADQNIARFRTWNFNAGANSGFDYFFNNLVLADTPALTTSVTVKITRSAGSGSEIPQDWRDRYNLVDADNDDSDADGLTTLQEWWADTVPTNINSYFGYTGVKPKAGEPGVYEVEVKAPTTNSRIYGISSASNLMGGIWTPYSIIQTGRADGGALIFTITNDTDAQLYYRSKVGME